MLTSPGLLKLCPFGLPETDMVAGVIQVPGTDHNSKVGGTTSSVVCFMLREVNGV